jgi:ABC-type glycerol-3-phosphate transport system permease component
MDTTLKHTKKKAAREWHYGHPSVGSKVFDTVNILFMFLLMVITLYPFLYVLFASLSEPL